MISNRLPRGPDVQEGGRSVSDSFLGGESLLCGIVNGLVVECSSKLIWCRYDILILSCVFLLLPVVNLLYISIFQFTVVLSDR